MNLKYKENLQTKLNMEETKAENIFAEKNHQNDTKT